jgi:hypothetical protein
MATYRVLYWQEIPSQIRAEDDEGDVNVALSPKFMARIDALAAARGLEGADDYLAQWHWGEDQEREGSAQAVAEAVRLELEQQAAW